MVSRSKLVEVFRCERPRHIPVQQSLNYVGSLDLDFQCKRGDRPIIQFRAKLFAAFPHQTEPSVDIQPDDIVLESTAMKARQLGRLATVPLACRFKDERWAEGCLVWGGKTIVSVLVSNTMMPAASKTVTTAVIIL